MSESTTVLIGGSSTVRQAAGVESLSRPVPDVAYKRELLALSRRPKVRDRASSDDDLAYYDDFKVDSVPIKVDAVDHPQACNTGVKHFKVDRDAIKLHEKGVDFLRLTAVDEVGVEQLYYLADVVGANRLQAGDMVKDAGELGYCGHAVGKHLFWGQSHQGACLRASGKVGADLLDAVRASGSSRCFRATRIDFQATVMYPDPPGRGFFREFSDASDALSLASGRQGRPWYVALLDEYGRGDTCYIGARSSENFGRIYDKGRESPEQYVLGSVRFETEHKGSSATRLFEQLLDDSVEPSSFACGYVAAFFESRGVQLPIDVNAVDLLSSLKADTDADRQLRWLKTGVMPTVARLVKAGRSADVLQILLDAGLEF